MGDERLRVGVSACLLGQPVRFDGGHKRNRMVESLGEVADLVAVCPEVELGLGAPRESLRLIRRRGESEVALVATRSGRDLTHAMRAFAAEKVERIAAWDLDGFILKKDSPTCGVERVRVYGEEPGRPLRTEMGLFAAALHARLPLLPLEDEGRLQDADLRDAFLTRVFAYRRVKELFRGAWSMRDLVAFHTGEKLLLLAHDERLARALGRLVAKAADLPPDEVAPRYASAFMAALLRPAERGGHVNVMQHIAGVFKRMNSDEERRELAEVIEDYRRGLVPRAAPLALLRHHARRHGSAWLERQAYLRPYPKELGTSPPQGRRAAAP